MRGLYVVRGSLAQRFGHPLPDHLERTKGHDRTFGRPSRVVLRLILPLAAPACSLIWNNSGTDRGASAVVATSGRGGLLIAEEQGYVIRVADRPVYTPEYVAMRREVAQHIQSPWFTVGDNGRILKEDFVRGRHLADVPIEVQIDGVRELLRSLASLVASEGTGSSRSFVNASIAWVEPAELPPVVRRSIENPDFLELLSDGPLLPSHGDVVVSNVIMSDDGIRVIDWAPHRLALRPFWYDALTIIASPAVPDLFQEFLAGRFDDEFITLYAKAGCEFELGEVVDTLRTWVLLRAFEEQAQVPAPDERLMKVALKHWDRIHRGLAAGARVDHIWQPTPAFRG